MIGKACQVSVFLNLSHQLENDHDKTTPPGQRYWKKRWPAVGQDWGDTSFPSREYPCPRLIPDLATFNTRETVALETPAFRYILNTVICSSSLLSSLPCITSCWLWLTGNYYCFSSFDTA